MEPLLWNTLDEAADWLTAETGEKWSAKHVLSAALLHLRSNHRNTYLKAAMPRDTKFGLYEFNVDKGMQSNPFVRKLSTSWRTVPLYMKNIFELLIHGETSVSLVQSPNDEAGAANEYIFVEPLDVHGGHTITASIVGIARDDLGELLRKIGPVKQPTTDAIKKTNHTTKELVLLWEAIEKFWATHDSNAPPKKEIVVKWFTDKGVSKKMAESLDTLMRTDSARKGGNKKVAPQKSQ